MFGISTLAALRVVLNQGFTVGSSNDGLLEDILMSSTRRLVVWCDTPAFSQIWVAWEEWPGTVPVLEECKISGELLRFMRHRTNRRFRFNAGETLSLVLYQLSEEYGESGDWNGRHDPLLAFFEAAWESNAMTTFCRKFL